MVLKDLIFILLLTFCFLPFSKAKIQLTPQDVTNRILNNSNQSKEINLKAQMSKLNLILSESPFDWNSVIQTNYLHSRPETPSGIYNDQEQTLTTAMGVSKKFKSGSLMNLDFERKSYKYDIGTYSLSNTQEPVLVQDTFKLTFSQELMANAFGKVDRLNLAVKKIQYENDLKQRLENIEQLVLDTLKLYWSAFVAQENLKESLESRKKYEKLLNVVTRKKNLGYAKPGEFSQVRAEFESKNQQVKLNSNTYLELSEKLLTQLKISPDDIEFVIPELLKPLPELNEKNIDETRKILLLKNSLEIAQKDLESAQNKVLPHLSLNAQIATQGLDPQGEKSLGESMSGNHAYYSVGIRFEKPIGSDQFTEDVLNKKYAKMHQETIIERTRDELKDSLIHLQRKAQTHFLAAQSAQLQKEYREQQAKELSSSYEQGRTDLNELIQGLNAYFASQTNFTRTVGDYHMTLNEWAALRDELITDKIDTEKEGVSYDKE